MDYLARILSTIPSYKLKKIKYYNIACSFDIETTSFYHNDEKRAIMYVWQFAFSTHTVIIGRTWEEFNEFIAFIRAKLGLGSDTRLIVYIHNLAYEFGWLHRYFNIKKVMAVKELKPIKVLTAEGIEFKCSYLLTNQSLDTLSKNYGLEHYKRSGAEFDYTKIRNAKTPLTDSELDYICNDVLAVNEYIERFELPENGNKISRLPNTSTGKVRRYIKKHTIDLYHSGGLNPRAISYRDMIHSLRLTPEEYRLAVRAYSGGITHANTYHINKTLERVASQDFNSSYPASLCLYPYYPMSSGERLTNITTEKFKKYIKTHACIMELTFINIKSKLKQERIISASKCSLPPLNAQLDNGRVIQADALTIACTELDYFNYRAFYSWDKLVVNTMYVYKRGYLPRELINCVLDLYQAKTELKNVKGEEVNYMRLKERLNSTYGCTVTAIARPEITYDSELRDWTPPELRPEPDIDKAIKKYNEEPERFLFYLWGVYCSAISRYNLVQHGIKPLGMDYVYSDTDSVKYLNPEKNEHIFTDYNKSIMARIRQASRDLNIDINKFIPKTIKGEPMAIGCWSFEGIIRFKTLGAKRYMTQDENGKYKLTVAGLSKADGMEYIKRKYKDPFKAFNNNLYIEPEGTGKMTHTYFTKHIEGVITDYLGNTADYCEEAYIHLEPCPYDFSNTTDFIKFAYQLQTMEVPLK